MRDLDPQLAVYSMCPLGEVLSESLAQRRFAMLLLVAVALAACYVPARRATRVDPIVTLRQE